MVSIRGEWNSEIVSIAIHVFEAALTQFKQRLTLLFPVSSPHLELNLLTRLARTLTQQTHLQAASLDVEPFLALGVYKLEIEVAEVEHINDLSQRLHLPHFIDCVHFHDGPIQT